ncbi:MAG: VOC family protein [Actinobacteria bacterium]|nr:VOC family protein [Actinomycetota bacterium]
MARPLVTRPDHVAVAVPSIDAALPRWRDQLGGVQCGQYDSGRGFTTKQYRYRGGGKLELVEPTPPQPAGFVTGFLDRFGAGVHHITLLVPDLLEAVSHLRAEGFDVVDIRQDTRWHEAFLRPSQVGGWVVQIAWSARSPRDPDPPPERGATLVGPRLQHPHLDEAGDLWRRLGATVDPVDEGLRVWWEDAPLELRIRQGTPPGPMGLRFADAPAAPTDPVLGAGVEPITLAEI